jgi:Shedu protein SduA, C-terminal/HNH endonuclease
MACGESASAGYMMSVVKIITTTLKRLYADSAGLCAISDCPYPNQLEDGTPILEVAHIASVSQYGIRPDSEIISDEANDLPNLILLCPTHHRAVDALPSEYTAQKLRLIRDSHVEHVQRILASAARQGVGPRAAVNKLQQALQTWERERQNSSEEYWQELFHSRPELLAPTVQGRAFALKSKCYVGGKTIDNSGGNVLDFLAQHEGDVVLVEIKTPTTKLLRAEYRANVYPPSRELTGAVVQALHYRLSLLNDLHSLRSQSSILQVHDPGIFVVVGDAEREGLLGAKRQSFELFRHSMKSVEILTYDELFNGLANQAIWMEPAT